MQIHTQTYTKVNVRKVAECFAADLSMLARRIQAMDQQLARDMARDITLMALHDCLAKVHVQLLDPCGQRVAAYVYRVEVEDSWDQNRLGTNNWLATLGGAIGGTLVVIVSYSNPVVANSLKRCRQLRIDWGPMDRGSGYSGMCLGESKQYFSGRYGWSRTTYLNRSRLSSAPLVPKKRPSP